MAEDDKRRRGSRAAVVLLNELVSLKLPYPVCVVLNLLESKAAQEQKESSHNSHLGLTEKTRSVWENSLEDSYEQVEQQNVGKQQVHTEHDDGEPLGEGRRLVVIQNGTLGLQTIRAVQAAGVYVKRSICMYTQSLLLLFLINGAAILYTNSITCRTATSPDPPPQ